jgi:hypothetical protein
MSKRKHSSTSTSIRNTDSAVGLIPSASTGRRTRTKLAHEQSAAAATTAALAADISVSDIIRNASGRDYMSGVLGVRIYLQLVFEFLSSVGSISTRFALRRLRRAWRIRSEEGDFWCGLTGIPEVIVRNPDLLVQLLDSIPNGSQFRCIRGLQRIDISNIHINTSVQLQSLMTLLSTGESIRLLSIGRAWRVLEGNNLTELLVAGLRKFQCTQLQELRLAGLEEKDYKPILAALHQFNKLRSLSFGCGIAIESSVLTGSLQQIPPSLRSIQLCMAPSENDNGNWARTLAPRIKSLTLHGGSNRLTDATLLPGLSQFSLIESLTLHDYWRKPQGVGIDLRCTLTEKFWNTLVQCSPGLQELSFNHVCNIKSSEMGSIFPCNGALSSSGSSRGSVVPKGMLASAAAAAASVASAIGLISVQPNVSPSISHGPGLSHLRSLEFRNCDFLPYPRLLHDILASGDIALPLQELSLSVCGYPEPKEWDMYRFVALAKKFANTPHCTMKSFSYEGHALSGDELHALVIIFPSLTSLRFHLDTEYAHGAELLQLSGLPHLRTLHLDLSGKGWLTQKDRNKRLNYSLAELLAPLVDRTSTCPSLRSVHLHMRNQRLVTDDTLMALVGLFTPQIAGSIDAVETDMQMKKGRGRDAKAKAASAAAASAAAVASAPIVPVAFRSVHPVRLSFLNISATDISDTTVLHLARIADILGLQRLLLHNCTMLLPSTVEYCRMRCRDTLIEFTIPTVSDRHWTWKKRDLSWIDR